MKLWITKYALTKGIQEVDAVVKSGSKLVTWGGWFNTAYGEGRQWHRTKEDAIIRAYSMRLHKIESLKKQIKNLESLNF